MRAAVIGGGFSGLVSTLYLLESGLDVDLYEEHRRVGYPPHCTGLVSERVVQLLGSPGRSSVVSHYRRLHLRYNGYEAIIEPRGGVYKLDRIALEEAMLGEALDRGANALLGVHVDHVSLGGVVRAGGREDRYDIVILAEGAHGLLARSLGIAASPSYVYGLNAHYKKGDTPDDGIVIDFSPQLHNGLFAWLLETGQGEVLAGTGGSPARVKTLLGAVEEGYRLHNRTQVYGGRVLLGPPARRPWRGRVIAVGDAAGLTKPLTGGGLYPSTITAYNAYRLTMEGMDPLAAWRKAVAGTVRQLRAQHLLASRLLRDSGLVGSIIRALSESGLDRGLAGRVDYDRHEDLPFSALGSGRVLGFVFRLVRGRPLGSLSLAVRGLAAWILSNI